MTSSTPWVAEPLSGKFEIEDARIEGDLANVRAAGGRIARSRLEKTLLAGSRLRSLALVYVVADAIEASAVDWTGGRLNRVVFDGCRMTGLILGQTQGRRRRLPQLPAQARELRLHEAAARQLRELRARRGLVYRRHVARRALRGDVRPGAPISVRRC